MSLNMEEITKRVIEKLNSQTDDTVEIEASGRHIHLSREHIDALFGSNYELTPAKYLSQPGQFAAKERLSIIGPKAVLHNVVILGPERKQSQIEVSQTDSLTLGVKVPVRMSGEIEETPGVLLANGAKIVALEKGLIIAKRHIHIKASEAERLQVKQNDSVKVKVMSERPVTFEDVVIRVSPEFENSMHIDYDEANACGFVKGTRGTIIT